jgi:hypothetical protein
VARLVERGLRESRAIDLEALVVLAGALHACAACLAAPAAPSAAASGLLADKLAASATLRYRSAPAPQNYPYSSHFVLLCFFITPPATYLLHLQGARSGTCAWMCMYWTTREILWMPAGWPPWLRSWPSAAQT